jgi:hypothetical protein
MPSVKRRASKILNEYSFQNIPIKMKSPTSVRKVTPMIATVRNTSLAERKVMNASHLEAPGVNQSG